MRNWLKKSLLLCFRPLCGGSPGHSGRRLSVNRRRLNSETACSSATSGLGGDTTASRRGNCCGTLGVLKLRPKAASAENVSFPEMVTLARVSGGKGRERIGRHSMFDRKEVSESRVFWNPEKKFSKLKPVNTKLLIQQPMPALLPINSFCLSSLSWLLMSVAIHIWGLSVTAITVAQKLGKCSQAALKWSMGIKALERPSSSNHVKKIPEDH